MVTIDREMVGILAILFGILIIIFPAVLGYLVGGFLIIFGFLTLLGKKI